MGQCILKFLTKISPPTPFCCSDFLFTGNTIIYTLSRKWHKFVSVFHFVIFYYPLELWNEMEFIFYTVPALGRTEDFSNVEHKVTVCHWAGAISSKSISESIYNWFFYPAVHKKPTNCRSALDPLLLLTAVEIKDASGRSLTRTAVVTRVIFQSQWDFISPASPQQRICSFCHSCQWQFITSYFLS